MGRDRSALEISATTMAAPRARRFAKAKRAIIWMTNGRDSSATPSADEVRLTNIIAEVVLYWFEGNGEAGIFCDEVTSMAVARDVLARAKQKKWKFSSSM
jgi:hypothetical protein